MPTQSNIDAHAARMAVAVSSFELAVANDISVVTTQAVGTLISTLDVSNGIVDHTTNNLIRLGSFPDTVRVLLNRSRYNPLVLAFVSDLIYQIDEFRNLMEDDPRFETFDVEAISDDLSEQAGAAIVAFDAHAEHIIASIQLLVSRALVGSNMADLISGLSDMMRKISKVNPIAMDHTMIWFRLIGNLVYRQIEDAGANLRFVYVGPSSTEVRDFCQKLGGKTFSRREIDHLDNKKIPGVFNSGGGYGCHHWWAPVLLELIP